MRRDNPFEDFIFFVIGFIPIIWLALLVAPYIHKGLFYAVAQMSETIKSPFSISWYDNSLRTIFIFSLTYTCTAIIYIFNKKNLRRKEEYGSAKWANSFKVNRKYSDKDYKSNKLLTQNVHIGLDGKKHRRNLNTIVIGGSGAGKTRFYGKPNIMQCNTSFVVLDPKGGARRSYMKSVRTSQI